RRRTPRPGVRRARGARSGRRHADARVRRDRRAPHGARRAGAPGRARTSGARRLCAGGTQQRRTRTRGTPSRAGRSAVAAPSRRAPPPEPRGTVNGGHPPLVSVCVVTYGAREWVERTLHTLVAHTAEDRYEIVLVDNGSTDGTDAFVRRFAATAPAPTTVECCGRNLGFGAGNNLAANRARGGVLCFLNSDVLVPAGWLDGLLAPLLAH